MFKRVLSFFLLAAGLSAAAPVFADEPSAAGRPLPGLVIVSPANGALLEGLVTVNYAVREPASSAGPGGSAGENRRLKVCLLIDAPPPESGSPVYVDGGHALFPDGQKSVTVSVTRGRHRLQLVLLGPDGRMGDDLVTSPSVTIEAQ